jgi:hypothetical protein
MSSQWRSRVNKALGIFFELTPDDVKERERDGTHSRARGVKNFRMQGREVGKK